MSWLSSFEAATQKDEQWVVKEISTGWKALQSAEQTAAVDVINVFGWIQAHQQQILSVFQGVLTDATAIGSIIPAVAPEVAIATTALDAATAAIDVASAGITAGSTPLSTLSSAYQLSKTAASAVNAVLQKVAAEPVAAPAAAPAPG